MSGFMVFWSKEQLKQYEKHGDKGPLRVIYGSRHTVMPSLSAVKVGDVLYAVCVREQTLCAMARLPVERLETAFYYILRETGRPHGALIPEGVLIKETGHNGKEFISFKGGCGYADKTEPPDNIHTVLYEKDFKDIPHLYHQEPITCCAKIAAVGDNGSAIEPRMIPLEDAKAFRFGRTKKSQEPLKLDKNGKITSTFVFGSVRKMSDETFEYFEGLFR